MYDYTLPQPPLDSRPNSVPVSLNNSHGLPNSVREALLSANLGKAALVMDALLYCNMAQGTVFNFEKAVHTLYKQNIMLSKTLIRTALNSGVFQIGVVHTRRRGRPEKVYTMPDVDWMVKKYAQGAATASDELVLKDMQNLRLYRQALHREFIRRAPGIYSRLFLGERLGVGKRCIRNYDQREGIRAIRRLSQQNMRWYINGEDLLIGAKPGINWLRILYKNGKTFDAPPLLGIARNNLWKKYVKSVFFVTQLCNRYVYAPEADWADHQYLYKSDDERSFADSTDPKGLRKERLNYDPISITLSIDRKAYKPKSDPISASLPQYMIDRRTVRQPHLPRYKV